MSLDLRNAFGHFATGVTIITMIDRDGRRIGMTANSFSSLSLDPPMVLWNLARTSVNHDSFCGARHFAVHVLDSRQTALARHFATKDIDRFAEHPTVDGEHGLPLLTAATTPSSSGASSVSTSVPATLCPFTAGGSPRCCRSRPNNLSRGRSRRSVTFISTQALTCWRPTSLL